MNGLLPRRAAFVVALLASAGVMACPASSSHIGGLEGYWKFDEGSGTTAFDSSGHGRDGKILGATYVTDVSPALGSTFALRFEHEQTVEVPDSDGGLDFGPLAPFTIALWFKRTGSSFYNLIGKRATCGDAESTINYQLAEDPQGNFHFNSQNSGRVDTFIATKRRVWIHAAASYDPTAEVLRVYLNGVEVASASGYTLSGRNNAPLVIGDSDSCAEHFGGKIDDVRIYRRTLSGGEIADLARFHPQS
jgi:hypothetical protein